MGLEGIVDDEGFKFSATDGSKGSGFGIDEHFGSRFAGDGAGGLDDGYEGAGEALFTGFEKGLEEL